MPAAAKWTRPSRLTRPASVDATAIAMSGNPSGNNASPFDPVLRSYEERLASALAMGGADKLARRKAAGFLNARERIAYICDPGSFIETGLFGTSSSNPVCVFR